MLKSWVFVLAALVAGNSLANTQIDYNADSATAIASIYWLSKDQDSAIVYARFEGFHAP